MLTLVADAQEHGLIDNRLLLNRNVTPTLLNNTKTHPHLNYLLQKVAHGDIIYIQFICIFIYINWSGAYFLKPMLGFCLYFPREKCQCAASL